MKIIEVFQYLIVNYRFFYWQKDDLKNSKEIYLGNEYESQVIIKIDERSCFATIERYLTIEFEQSKVLSNLKYSSETQEYQIIEQLIDIIQQEQDPFFSNCELDDEMRVSDTTEFINENFNS